jgi:hypothetical protein
MLERNDDGFMVVNACNVGSHKRVQIPAKIGYLRCDVIATWMYLAYTKKKRRQPEKGGNSSQNGISSMRCDCNMDVFALHQKGHLVVLNPQIVLRITYIDCVFLLYFADVYSRIAYGSLQVLVYYRGRIYAAVHCLTHSQIELRTNLRLL